MTRHSVLFAFFFLWLTFTEYAFCVPMLDSIELHKAIDPNHLRVKLQGRSQADEFTQINDLIAQGRSLELFTIANRVQTKTGESGLVYEVKGVANLMQQQTSAAIENFRKAISLEPDQSDIHAKLGLVLMETGELQLAETALAKALELDNDNMMAHRNLGLLKEYQHEDDTAIFHLLRGLQESSTGFILEATTAARLLTSNDQAQLAINILEPRLPLNSDNAAAQFILANSLLESQRWEDALTRFERAEALNPGDQTIRLGKAVALRGAGRAQESITVLHSIPSDSRLDSAVLVELGLSFQSARDETAAKHTFNEAIKSGVKADDISLQRARQYLRDKQYTEAADVFSQLVENNSSVPEVYISLSELKVAAGDVESGILILQQAERRLPDNANVVFRLGSLIAAAGRYKDAATILQRANRLAPGNRKITQTLSGVHTRLGNHIEAAKLAAGLQSGYPKDPQIQLFAALAFSRAGQTAKSIEAYKRVLEIQPDNTLVLNNLANLMVETGDLEGADRMSSLALKTMPENATILDTYGFVKYSQAQYEAAQSALEEAVSLSPDMAIAHYHLGLVKASQNKAEEARAMLERARTLDPGANWISSADELLRQLDEG